MDTIAFTGHRPDKLGGYDEDDPQNLWVKSQIRKAIEHYHPKKVITGGALGVDTWAAEEALLQGIPLWLCIPFNGFENRWPSASLLRYRATRDAATQLSVVCSDFSVAAYQRRNEFMVDHCNLLVAIWDGSPGGTANCVRYAQRVRRDIRRIDPSAWQR